MSSAHACQSARSVPTAGPAIDRRRHPERTVLYEVFQEYLESYLARARWEDPSGEIVPAYVEREFRKYLQCGILSYGFARAKCADCGQDSRSLPWLELMPTPRPRSRPLPQRHRARVPPTFTGGRSSLPASTRSRR